MRFGSAKRPDSLWLCPRNAPLHFFESCLNPLVRGLVRRCSPHTATSNKQNGWAGGTRQYAGIHLIPVDTRRCPSRGQRRTDRDRNVESEVTGSAASPRPLSSHPQPCPSTTGGPHLAVEVSRCPTRTTTVSHHEISRSRHPISNLQSPTSNLQPPIPNPQSPTPTIAGLQGSPVAISFSL